MTQTKYMRPQAKELIKRLGEPRRFIQSLSGARQVGKTTLVLQVAKRVNLPGHFASADETTLREGRDWIASQWTTARQLARQSEKGALLILDEIQKIPQWSSAVKSLWDEDTRQQTALKVVLLGSAPLLVGRGLTESLAGRFESLHLPHWSFSEMRAAFGWNLEQYLAHGAYPGAAPLIGDVGRWSEYIRNSLMETTISRDVLLLSRIDKPVLLRRLFELGCLYSGQILSYRKIAGQLQDVGNVTTLAHYLDLLAGTGTVAGLQKFTGSAVASRRSIPKLQVFNTALITAQSGGALWEDIRSGTMPGRLVESAVGAHLLNAAAGGALELFYWRENNLEVDFVVRAGKSLLAIEVKSGRPPTAFPGLDAFARKFKSAKRLIVGSGGIPLEAFLSTPVARWME